MHNTLKAELIPICHLLTLLGAQLIFHVSRIMVKGDGLVYKVIKSTQKKNPLQFKQNQKQPTEDIRSVLTATSITQLEVSNLIRFSGDRVNN
jgi:hypothetical protein